MNQEMIEAVESAVTEVVGDINNTSMASSFVNLGSHFVRLNPEYNPDDENSNKYIYDAKHHLRTFDAMLNIYNSSNGSDE